MTRLSLGGVLLVALAFSGCQKDDEAAASQEDMMASRLGPLDQGVPPIDQGAPIPDIGPDSEVDGAISDQPIVSSACGDGVDNDEDGYIDLDDRGCESAEDDDEANPITACADGLDNDGDGRVDLADSDCANAIDPAEEGADPVTACNNQLDDDQDGLTDFPYDPGCGAAGDTDEQDPPVLQGCGNGQDDDDDGLIDYPNDPGCAGTGDPDETDAPVTPECADGEDNDENGSIDFPADTGCESAGDYLEASQCGQRGGEVVDLRSALDAEGGYNGTTENQDALFLGSCGGNAGGEAVFSYRIERPLRAIAFSTDHPETTHPTVLYARRSCGGSADLACNRGTGQAPGTRIDLANPTPGLYYIVVDTGSRNVGAGPFRLTVEETGAPHCRDEIDNDEDGLLDLADPGCRTPEGESEEDPEFPPQCFDNEDNDLDGLVDYPDDDNCTAAGGDSEGPRCMTDFPNVAELGQAGGLVPVVVEGVGEGLTDGTCRVRTGPEFVVALTLDEFSSVTVTPHALGEHMPLYMLHMREDCDDITTELSCQLAFDGPAHFAGLPAGIYYFFIDHQVFNAPMDQIEVAFEVVSRVTECNDEADNDGDGLVDLADTGCVDFEDRSEMDPPAPPGCGDGIDNDEDGLIDWPADDGCTGSGDDDENFACIAVPIAASVGPGGGQVRVDTSNSGNNFSGSNCGAGGRGQDAVVTLNLPRAAHVTAEIVEAGFDTVLHMRALCDDEESELACNDDGGDGALSIIDVDLDAGVYFFIADGYSANSGGPMTLEFTIR